jgi:class 3 adenylate cyclase/tetratricopeptide (TPR) repeat protein
MSDELQQLEVAIAAFEAQRAVVGDAMVEMATAPLRARLAALTSAGTSAPEPQQSLKQVSIVFMDVVGSTTLSQRLDPEEISAVMDDALRRGTAIVRAHHGKVLQYAGDNILAAFGADEAREDDAERAVRCGLALLELGSALGAEVLAAHGHEGFDVRVGIHTGGVLLGGGVDADGTIRGVAVNIAARMEQTAPSGALRISQDTYAQVRGMFEVEAQEPLLVKGVDEPIQSYLVLRAKPRSFRIGTRGIEGVATRMIGREAELAALQDAFRRLFVERRLAAVTVVADAGIGKSRLLYEFEAWSETRPELVYLFRGRATPQTQGQPFGLLRDILAWRFQIADDDSIDAARAKMEQGIVPLFEEDDGADLAEGHAHLLGHLIGIEWRASRHLRGILDDPQQIRNRALHAAAQMFRKVSAGKGSRGDGVAAGTPVVLQLEDLHWADNNSLDFLAHLCEVSGDVPLLILAFTRPTLFERRADWQRALAGQRIELKPLEKAQSRELAGELLKKLPEVPAAVRELVTGGSEGNPFYMEELVKMLIDQGAISTGAESWALNADKLLATKVPPTLTGVLQARLDGLPAVEKRTLQEASVIGPVFWDQALVALDASAKDALPSLVNRELALPRADAALEGLREYAFRHQMLHQVTYDTVLKRTRRDLHGKVAHWFSGLTGLRARDFLGATAEHYERAGDDANAAEFHARAAEHARERFGHDAVLDHVGKAIALLDTHPSAGHDVASLRWRLLRVREETLDLQARRAEQGADIEELQRLADILASDARRAYAAWRRSYRTLRMADWPACQSAAQRSMAFAESAGDHALRLHALRLLASALAMQGDLVAGKALASEGLADARARGLGANEEALLNTLIVIANMQGDVVANLDLSRQNLLINRAIGDRRSEAIALANLGVAWLELGDLEQAWRDSQEALRMLRANGDRVIEGVTLCNLSDLALMQGDGRSALTLARSALDILVATQARDREVDALLKLGQAELALGHYPAARQAFEQMRRNAMQIESAWQHDATAGLAQVALAEGDLPTALRQAETVLAHASSGGTIVGAVKPRLIELTCHRVLARASDPRATVWLTSAHDALQAQAATIPDPALRQGFLENIPHHREIVAAWAAWHGMIALKPRKTP